MKKDASTILKEYLDVREVEHYNHIKNKYETEETLIVRPIHINKRDLDEIKKWLYEKKN